MILPAGAYGSLTATWESIDQVCALMPWIMQTYTVGRLRHVFGSLLALWLAERRCSFGVKDSARTCRMNAAFMSRECTRPAQALSFSQAHR